MRRNGRPRGLVRVDADLPIDLTQWEARALVRAIDLVVHTLRPHLFADRPGQHRVTQPPLITARQVLIAACERAGYDTGPNLAELACGMAYDEKEAADFDALRRGLGFIEDEAA